jgi:putative transposase
MARAEHLRAVHGTRAVCQALSVPRASFYRALRRQAAPPAQPAQRRACRRALTAAEREQVLTLLHSPRFADASPAQVYATLLDEQRYLCSVRTMYRLLNSRSEVRERRNQLRHPKYNKPELLATGPNQVWSWDITKLRGPAKWVHYSLYVILDIFSRRVVGWLLADRESQVLAERLIADTITKHQVPPGQLTLHADRGSSMKSKPVALLLADLGVTKTHSRPHTSNDNPYSEAQFKTLKYHPHFPDRFGCLEDARTFCRQFFDWYNNEHRHGSLALLTPNAVHYGQAEIILQRRAEVRLQAFHRHPERFRGKPPKPDTLPAQVWINPPRLEPQPPPPPH